MTASKNFLDFYVPPTRGATSSMKFHSMTSSCLFNRGTNFSQMSQIKFSSQRFRKWELFSFNQYADRTIRAEKISSLIQTLDSVLNSGSHGFSVADVWTTSKPA